MFETSSDTLESILVSIGQHFQIQDDFLDCFADPKVTGKIGTDIQEGKCTWLIVKALHHKNITDDLIEQLRMHYAKKDESSVSIVKSIFSHLNLPQLFKDEESVVLADLRAKIQLISDQKIVCIVQSLINQTFGRKN